MPLIQKIHASSASSLLLVLLLSLPATAGTLTPSNHPGCDYEFRGQIAPGDARSLGDIGGSYSGVTLCLNSPGGSVEEGLLMFKTIRDSNIKTRIPSGWKCESACAVAFMAGSISTGVGVPRTYSAHQLDPGGRLGFHAPGLALGQQNFTREQVDQAFSIALQSASLYYRSSLQEQDGWQSFNEYLYIRILETPSSSMYHIATVADAVLAGISLGPVRLPQRITEAEIENICDSAFLRRAPMRWRMPKESAQTAYDTLRYRLPKLADSWEREYRTVTINHSSAQIIGRVGGYAMNPSPGGRVHGLGCEVRFPKNAQITTPYLFVDGSPYTDNAAQVHLYRYITDIGQTQWWHQRDDIERKEWVPLWYLFEPDVPLASLDPAASGFRATHRVQTFPGGLVNLRSGPGTSHAVLTELPHGTGLALLRSGPDGWLQITTAQGITGWISGQLVAPPKR